MKKFTISVVHIIIATIAFIWFGVLKAQSNVEMIPYRLVPTYDSNCNFEIEIIEPVIFRSIVKVHSEEMERILRNRIIYEITHPFAQNNIFIIDDNYYYLIRVPYTDSLWDGEHGRYE